MQVYAGEKAHAMYGAGQWFPERCDGVRENIAALGGSSLPRRVVVSGAVSHVEASLEGGYDR